MKRYLPRILFCLLLGVATTVGVAWGLAVLVDTEWAEEPTRLGLSLESPRVSWVAAEQRSGLSVLFNSIWSKTVDKHTVAQSDWHPQEIIPDWTGFSNPVGLTGEGNRYVIDIADCRGWPYLALWSHSTHAVSGGTGIVASPSTRAGLQIGLQPTQNMYGHVVPRLLPTHIILQGFFLNALFYGVIWLGLFLGIGATRRAIRRKRGRCPVCGYNLLGDFESGCPECGWNRIENAEMSTTDNQTP